MTLILTLSVGFVVFPGQILNCLLIQIGTLNEIGLYIEDLDISRLKLASIIILGVDPALESLTGFGVSLFFIVPLFIHLFSLRKALLLSLLSMNIMPWGTLSLSPLIGAQISHIPFVELSYQTSLISSLVYPMIGILLYFICQKNKSFNLINFIYPVCAGILLSSSLVFYNIYTTPELAGVYAGITVVSISLMVEFLFRKRKRRSTTSSQHKSIFIIFLPS